ncbi:hypothetical protein EDC94DRAFT_587241 [Helicostylum pulchrum]|nr:hypothetical protein EDC94DRAFT_587241 [Helicostylum pulchrum]
MLKLFMYSCSSLALLFWYFLLCLEFFVLLGFLSGVSNIFMVSGADWCVVIFQDDATLPFFSSCAIFFFLLSKGFFKRFLRLSFTVICHKGMISKYKFYAALSSVKAYHLHFIFITLRRNLSIETVSGVVRSGAYFFLHASKVLLPKTSLRLHDQFMQTRDVQFILTESSHIIDSYFGTSYALTTSLYRGF